MGLLDDKLHANTSTADVPVSPIILKYGIIGSVIIVVISSTSSFIFEMEFNTYFWLFNWGFKALKGLTYIGIMYLAIKRYKQLNEGFITFKNAFIVSYLPGCIIAIMDMVASIALIYIGGTTIEHVAETGGTVLENFSPFLIYLMGGIVLMFAGMLGGALVAIFISLITKKERPKTFNVV